MRRQTEELPVLDRDQAGGKNTAAVEEGAVLEAAGFLDAGVDAEACVDYLCAC